MSNSLIMDKDAAAVSLAAFPLGVPARVIALKDSGTVARRLMEMGVVPGVQIRLVKTAPFGDPVEVCVRNYRLALRRTELQLIFVAAEEG